MTSIGTAASRKTVRGIALLTCMQALWSPAVADPPYDTAPILNSPSLFAQVRAPADGVKADEGTGPEIAAASADATGKDPDPDPSILAIPFGFYNESFGGAAAYVYAKGNYPQRDSMLLGTIMAGTKGSVLGFLIGRNLPIPRVDRLFVDPILSAGYYAENDVYIDGNPRFPDERAGTNSSDEDDFVEGDGIDFFFRARFKYLLPIGHGRDHIIPDYKFDRGLLVGNATGAETLNPLTSGRTFLSLRPFYRNLQVDGDNVDETLETGGVDFTLQWDNRDYPMNPARGQAITVEYNLDPGIVDESWDVVQVELEHYWDLGRSERFRQRTLALNFWTAHALSWEETPSGDIKHQPPAYTGATLGGLWRMRGFPTQRFNDRSAIYYSAELRLTPEWNPFVNWPRLQKHLGVEWLQFAPFVEVGRVASDWDFSELHEDMKYSGGLGIRARARGLVVRLDMAGSDEGVGIQMMVGMPFGFR
jgi:hypothetical protein